MHRYEREAQEWLLSRIAESLEVDKRDIDPSMSFSSSGLDSVAAVGIAGELEKRLGSRLSPTLLWDYPNVEALAQHLCTLEDAQGKALFSQ